MEIFIERENELNLSWHPGCMFMGMKTSSSCYSIGEIGSTGCVGNTECNSKPEYIVGAIGSKGPSCSEQPKEITPITKVPSSIKMSISFKNKNDSTLYETILNIVRDLQKSGDQIEINHTQPRLRRDKVKIKDKFHDEYEKMEERNSSIRQKFIALCTQLEELGCFVDDLGQPKYERVPENWYEINEYTDYSCCSIGVCCHDDTIFYKYLKEKGLLDKYFPEWYKNRQF